MHRILLALAMVACSNDRASEPRRSPAPVVEPATGRRVIPRSELESWSGLPARAIFTIQMGLGSKGPVQRQIVIDLDTRRIEAVDSGYTTSPPPRLERGLDARELDGIRELAEAAWRAAPPQLDQATDYREVVIVTEGDAAYMFSAYSPIGGDSPVARVVAELRRLAGWPR